MPIEQASFHCPQCRQQKLFTRQATSHLVHALITLFLCGLWIPIWLLIAISESNKPFFCSNCGYADLARYLSNPMLRQQQINQAQQKSLEPSAWENIKTSSVYRWATHADNTWKLAAGFFVIAISITAYFALFPDKEANQTVSRIVNTPAPTIRQKPVATSSQIQSYLGKNYPNTDVYSSIQLVRITGDTVEAWTNLSQKNKTATSVCSAIASFVYDSKNQDYGLTKVYVYDTNGKLIIQRSAASENCK